jgi:hypothetical protein
MLYADLKVAQNGFVVIGVLQLLYIVTPYDMVENMRLNLSNYYNIVSILRIEILLNQFCIDSSVIISL